MKVAIKSLGTQLLYPYGFKGPSNTLRRYLIETADGRVDIIEEWDEPLMPEGEYEFSEETLDKIFDRQVELAEDEW